MLIRRLFLLLPFLLVTSCKQTVQISSEPVDFSITSPQTGWTYYDTTQIMLAVNVDTSDIIWTSSISGDLGKGNHVTLFLPTGLHNISAEIQGVKKEREIYIAPAIGNANHVSTLVNYTPLEIKVKNGNYHSLLYTNKGTVNDFQVVTEQAVPYLNKRVHSGILPANTGAVPFRDLRLPMPKSGKHIDNSDPRQRSARIRSDTLITSRNFFVVNTSNQYSPPHTIEAELFYQSDVLSVWLPVSSGLSESLLNQVIQTAETIIIPRVFSLWGQSADIDANNRISLLFSNTLNEEGVALGFFNPADFFERNVETDSESYNPSSNEMDIIYLAFPDADPNSSYNINSIRATLAHELTHASTFTVKTWNRVKNGEIDAAQEELFLDEGWSHLSENLCGFGVSGGNIKFLNRFFVDTSLYSFCGANRNGQEDSAGMRGAMTLFLSWLFWNAGGMSWETANPVTLSDQGGISFLKRMVTSPETGWESIGNAFGKPVYLLFNTMLDEINSYRVTNRNYHYSLDPLTNEAVDFFVNMGSVPIPESASVVDVGFPKYSSIFSPNTLLPWSFVCFEPFPLATDSIITLNARTINRDVFYTLQRE